jgi:fused signal recognition particle receptor
MKFLSGLGERLREGLRRSQEYLSSGLQTVLEPDRPIDDALWEELEELLIGADLGAVMAADFVNRGREEVMYGTVTRATQLRPVLRRFLLDTLGPARPLGLDARPSVVLVLGVNGSGKTTTCAKLAASLKADGRHVMLAAADTFRAAAIEQLETWGRRIDVEVVRQAAGSDPAAVVFDAVKAAMARSADALIIDTAGRLHTKTGLMDELGKVKRVVEKHGPVDETLLVLDATTGQNGLEQARVFTDVVDVTGVVLTKLDGTAKGGIVIAVQRKLGIPVKLVGLGEGKDDLAPFEPKAFVEALLGTDA